MVSSQHDAVIPLVPHLYLHFLDFEVNPDSGHMASCKLVVGEACHQAGLTRRGITQQDYLDRNILFCNGCLVTKSI